MRCSDPANSEISQRTTGYPSRLSAASCSKTSALERPSVVVCTNGCGICEESAMVNIVGMVEMSMDLHPRFQRDLLQQRRICLYTWSQCCNKYRRFRASFIAWRV